MFPGSQNQYAVLGNTMSGEGDEALANGVGKRGRVSDVKAQFDGGGNLVDVLASRPRGTDETDCEFRIGNS